MGATADSPRIAINGRFLGQPLTGVQRFAREMVAQLDGLVEERGGALRLLAPRGAPLSLPLAHVEAQHCGRLNGHLWEQLELGWAAGDDLLLGLGFTGPLARRRQVVTMMDARVFVFPGNHSPMFGGWYRAAMPRLAKNSKCVLTISEFSRSELARYCRVDPDRFRVVFVGSDHLERVSADDEILRTHGLEPGRYVVAIGSASPNKNFGAVARAFEALDDDRISLAIVGSSDPSVFRGGVLPEGKRIVPLGVVSDGQLKALYAHALCLAFPAIYEGFGIPPVEAMRAGCPVVAARSSSIPEVCGEAVLYCDPMDPATLVEPIRRIRDDVGLADELRGRGRERAERFTWRRSAELLWEAVTGA